MAITRADYEMWSRLRERNHIPSRPAVLQIGEANWFGDIPLDNLYDLANLCGATDGLRVRIDGAIEKADSFAIARCFYDLVMTPLLLSSIDIHGTHLAWREDLNYHVVLPRKYHVVINTGTAEHVFDIAQVFETMHIYCEVGGLMYHCFPFRGWLDHGFYNINPTLLEDLAKANHYEILAASYFELNPYRFEWLECPMRDIRSMYKAKTLGEDALLYIAWRKTKDFKFRVPMQGAYADVTRQDVVNAYD